MADGKTDTDGIVGLLSAHYEKCMENSKPCYRSELKFKHMMGAHCGKDAENFRELASRGLNGYWHAVEEIKPCDLDGAEFEFEPELSLVLMKIPDDKINSVMKKLDSDGSPGETYSRQCFREGSPFCGINVVILPSSASDCMYEYRKSQVRFNEVNLPRIDIINSLEEVESVGDAKGEEYFRFMCMKQELRVLKEILSLKGDVDAQAAYNFAGKYARDIADSMYKTGILPNCGTVSKSSARNTAERCMRDRYVGLFKMGCGAFKTLSERELPRVVENIGMSCGSGVKEAKDTCVPGPVDEFYLWAGLDGKAICKCGVARKDAPNEAPGG